MPTSSQCHYWYFWITAEIILFFWHFFLCFIRVHFDKYFDCYVYLQHFSCELIIHFSKIMFSTCLAMHVYAVFLHLKPSELPLWEIVSIDAAWTSQCIVGFFMERTFPCTGRILRLIMALKWPTLWSVHCLWDWDAHKAFFLTVTLL